MGLEGTTAVPIPKQIPWKLKNKKINLADEIVDFLHDGDNIGYGKTEEELSLLEELRVKEREKQCIEIRQIEIVKKLQELRNKEST